MKDCDKNKELSSLIYWDVSNLHGWPVSQRLPVGGFEWVEDISKFNKDLKKTMKIVIPRVFS